MKLSPSTIENTLREKLEILINNFHKGEDDNDSIKMVLESHKLVKLSLSPHLDFLHGGDIELFCDFHATLFNYMDYLDAKSESVNKYISDTYKTLIFMAEEQIKDQPKLSCSLLRLAACAVNICYRDGKFEEGQQIITEIFQILNTKQFIEKKNEISPYLFGQLYFLEAKIQVRLANYDLAEELFSKAVISFEEWEAWKSTSPDSPKNINDFVSYKICVTQAFSSYAYILQGKLKKVLREASTIERLLKYSNHDKTRNFVKIIRARAMRLNGFGDQEKLLSVLRVLNHAEEPIRNNPIPASEEITFLNHNRHNLMRLFQKGLTYFYLHESDPDNKNGSFAIEPPSESYLEEMEKIVREIKKLNSGDFNSNYWTVRANLLEIYLLICMKDFTEAIRRADLNVMISIEGQVEDNVAKIETYVACAEARVNFVKNTKSEQNFSCSESDLLERAEFYLEECRKIEKHLNDETTKSYPSIFGRVYLLQMEIYILRKNRLKADEAWNHWSKIATSIENSRWHSIARKIKEELDNLEDRFIYKINGNFNIKDATEHLHEWFYKKAKSEYKADVLRIEALGVSRERYYKWKNQYDKESVKTINKKRKRPNKT